MTGSTSVCLTSSNKDIPYKISRFGKFNDLKVAKSGHIIRPKNGFYVKLRVKKAESLITIEVKDEHLALCFICGR
jgi:hypothetical protein